MQLDASSWSYALTGYDHHTFFDIDLLAEVLPSMDKQAAYLVTEMSLGERMALQWIDEANLISPIPESLAQRATPLAYLREHLQALIGVT